MIRAREIIGLPVISTQKGRRLGTVRDVLFDKDWRFEGILLNPRRLFFPAQIIGRTDLTSIGTDAVVVPGKEVLRRQEKNNGLFSLLGGKRNVKGLPIVTGKGVQLGRLEDIYFENPSEESIKGIEMTDGFISDLMEGRKLLPLEDGAVIGDDAIFVSEIS